MAEWVDFGTWTVLTGRDLAEGFLSGVSFFLASFSQISVGKTTAGASSSRFRCRLSASDISNLFSPRIGSFERSKFAGGAKWSFLTLVLPIPCKNLILLSGILIGMIFSIEKLVPEARFIEGIFGLSGSGSIGVDFRVLARRFSTPGKI